MITIISGPADGIPIVADTRIRNLRTGGNGIPPTDTRHDPSFWTIVLRFHVLRVRGCGGMR